MKNILISISLLAAITATAQPYTSFKADNGKYGYRDSLNTVVIEPKFDYASSFSEDMAIVRLNKKYGSIDMRGNLIIPCEYDDEPHGFHDGLAAFKLHDKWGFLNKAGSQVVSSKYTAVYDFSDGMAQVYENYENQFFIDKTGKELFRIDEYSEVGKFEYGLAKVRKKNKWGCIDKTGVVVIPIEYDHIYVNPDGSLALGQNGKWGYMDNKHQLIIPIIYGNLVNFKEDLAAVVLNDKWGFIDKTGKTQIPFQYDKLWSGFEGNTASVELNGKRFDIDKNGKQRGVGETIKIEKKKESQSAIFFREIQAILEAGDANHFSSIKGSPIVSSDASNKTYSCKLPLSGFKTTIIEKSGGILEFVASSTNYNAVNANVEFLKNETVREMSGMPGYVTHENAKEHFMEQSQTEESVTMLNKKGSKIHLLVGKLRNHEGYYLVTR